MKGSHVILKKTEAVQSWPVPKRLTQARQFIGTASYYRKFIPNFSEIAYPLTRLIKKSIQIVWSPDCQKAIDTLIQKLITPPVLAYPRPTGGYILDTDESNHAIGAVLSQVQDCEEWVIAYVSHNLKGGQLNYYTTKRKLFAVVTFVEHFRYYLYGQQFIVRTDHASLRWLRNFRNIDGLLTSWLSKLEKYDFTIVHRIGPQHGNADALSCIPHRKCPRSECPDCSSTVKKAYKISRKTRVDTDEWLEGWTTEDLLDWQRSDLVLKREISWLETPTQNPSGGVKIWSQG